MSLTTYVERNDELCIVPDARLDGENGQREQNGNLPPHGGQCFSGVAYEQPQVPRAFVKWNVVNVPNQLSKLSIGHLTFSNFLSSIEISAKKLYELSLRKI